MIWNVEPALFVDVCAVFFYVVCWAEVVRGSFSLGFFQGAVRGASCLDLGDDGFRTSNMANECGTEPRAQTGVPVASWPELL